MPNPLGLSFLPPDPSARYGGGGTPLGASPIQQAIQLLALHLPRVIGATSPIPAELLNALGGGGVTVRPGDEGLQDVLRRLMAPWMAGQMGAPMAMSPPPPSPPLPPMGPAYPPRLPRWTPGWQPASGGQERLGSPTQGQYGPGFDTTVGYHPPAPAPPERRPYSPSPWPPERPPAPSAPSPWR